MTADDREREMRLKAASFHEVTPETTGIEVRHETIKDGHWLEYISPDENTCIEGWVFPGADEAILTDHDMEITFSKTELRAWIAMMQKSLALLGGV